MSACSYLSSNVEEPAYEVLRQHGSIEHRRYPNLIAAEVEVTGERKQALNKGFRVLADYIFGNNASGSAIAMTAPVESQSKGEKIAMTAPVEHEGIKNDSWVVRFYMPREYTISTLPKPVDDRVKITEYPAQVYIVIQFSGRNTDRNLKQNMLLLDKYIEENQLLVVPTPKYAFYNPPWTIPLFKRNEIMYRLR